MYVKLLFAIFLFIGTTTVNVGGAGVNYATPFVYEFANGRNYCPPSHPNVYADGRYCCKYNREMVYKRYGKKCDGSIIRYNSKCCAENAAVECNYPSCKSYIVPRPPQRKVTISSPSLIPNSQGCWEKCGQTGGKCESICGKNGFCCREGFNDCPANIAKLNPSNQHACIRVPTTVVPGGCVTTRGGGKRVGQRCVFPFTLKGKICYGPKCCNLSNDPKGNWCSTKVDGNGLHITGWWGYCSRACSSAKETCKKTTGGNGNGRCCKFPFVYRGYRYSACTTAGRNDGGAWCSTTSNYNRDRRWGYCTGFKRKVTYVKKRECKNYSASCDDWMFKGFCTKKKYSIYMSRYCRKSCRYCP